MGCWHWDCRIFGWRWAGKCFYLQAALEKVLESKEKGKALLEILAAW